MRLLLLTLGLIVSLSVVAQGARDSGIRLDNVSQEILKGALEARILALQAPEGESLPVLPLSPVAPAVSSFYEQRAYQPVWSDLNRLQELIRALEGLQADGLDPEDYSIVFLRQMYNLLHFGQQPLVAEQVEWELLATNAYLRALYHLFNGKVDAAQLNPQWNFELHELSPSVVASLMNEGLISRRIADIFAQTRPQHDTYRSLQAGLVRYRQLAAAGGWPSIPAGPTLKPCMIDPQVVFLRQRLLATGEYVPVSAEQQALAAAYCVAANAASKATSLGFAAEQTNSVAGIESSSLASSSAAVINHAEVFDENLVAAVKQFQRDQYLEDDGAIGPATRAALNVSVQSRVDQIRVNLDRARWLLHNIPENLLLVDVAGFKVTYFKGGEAIWKSRVQVGMAYRTTPIFKSEVNYITLNPTWTVPPTILRKDVLPKVRKNLSYLRNNNIRVLDSTGAQLDPASIDWSRPGNVTLRQDAGPDAALGKAVIRFPNPYAVFLHDTPHQKLFDKSQRAFSSGCIRVERALELVELLLEETPNWDGEAINKTLAAGKTRNVTLAARVPIMLAYWTVDAVNENKVAFKPDIYAHDAAVLAALNQRVSQPVLTFVD
jgi:murein L,D-transpeptidase YcbB/YkuD